MNDEGFSRMTRKEAVRDIGRRINRGESKRLVYSSYAMTQWEGVATKALASLVTLANRKRLRGLNNALVALYSLMVLMNVVFVVMTLAFGSSPERIGGLLGGSIGLALNVWILVGLIRYNIFAHYALIGFGLNGISKVLQLALAGDVAAMISLCLISSSIALAFVLIRKLLPNTSFFFKPKRDVLGAPVFEN